MKECVIYKYVYHGDIIYIGKSDNSLISRIRGHEKETKFKPYINDANIFYFTCHNPAETTIYETYLINRYKPILNEAMKYSHTLGMEIQEPVWSQYFSREYEYIVANRLKYKKAPSKLNIEYFVLLDELISQKIIRESRRLYYKEKIPYSENVSINDVQKINQAFELLGTGQKEIIVAAELKKNFDICIIINASLLTHEFFENYKKYIGKAIRTYC